MGKNKSKHFNTYEEATEWFNDHDMTDFEDQFFGVCLSGAFRFRACPIKFFETDECIVFKRDGNIYNPQQTTYK